MKNITTVILIVLTSITSSTVGLNSTTLLGIATDGSRNKLVGINVFIKGTTAGTVTDQCGRFSIPANDDKFTLVFHGMSYDDSRTYEIALSKK